MDIRNRIGLYGSYFVGMAGIGFTLPLLPVYLGDEGLDDRQIGLVSTCAALAGLAQFPLGFWSDRLGRRTPFLLGALALLAAATFLLPAAHGVLWLGFLVAIFAENGVCRAVIESFSGAVAASLAEPHQVGRAVGALRFWKPIGIIFVAGLGSVWIEGHDAKSILIGLAVFQVIGVLLALLIRENRPSVEQPTSESTQQAASGDPALPRRQGFDAALWTFVAAMVLFHLSNAPGGVYLGLFMKRDLDAPGRLLFYAFMVSMVAWMLVVLPGGRLADRFGRRPLLVCGWLIMALRLALIAIARSAWEVVAIQCLDGVANGLFAVLAAAWVSDRLADARRAGEAQVIVGTSLVFGSAAGPALASLIVEPLGYRGLFWLLSGVGVLASAVVIFAVPETLASTPPLLASEPSGDQAACDVLEPAD